MASRTPRQRFLDTLDRKPPRGRVPHFELVFFLTMEAFGKVHPSHRNYGQWLQMEEKERQLHRADMADLFIRTAERYEHSAIFLHPNPGDLEEVMRLIDTVREKSGDRYCLMIHGGASYGVPNGQNMEEFSLQLIEEPDALKANAERMVDGALETAARLQQHGGLDCFAMCTDYCFNEGPFLSPTLFAEFVTPYITRLTTGYREMGFYTICHTDGNIMPILDQLVASGPHALHSLDPQGGVDIAEVKRLVGDQVCLIGNVHCGMMDTGTDEDVVASARYCLKNAMPNGGYVFATSNCVYTGMPLNHYDLMLDVWRQEGNYPDPE